MAKLRSFIFKNRKPFNAGHFALLCGLLTACSKAPPLNMELTEGAGFAKTQVTSTQPSFNVWPIATQILSDAALASEQLLAAIDQLLTEPTHDNHQLAREAWFNALRHIEPFYVYSRIPRPDNGETAFEKNYRTLALWPVAAGYLDGFAEHPYSGIVFDVGTPLTVEMLRQQHTLTSDTDALLGLYALGTVLFGEQNERAALTFMPVKVLSEAQVADGYTEVSELPRNRRRALVKLQAALLADDIARLRTEFNNKKPDGVAALFEKQTPFVQGQLLNSAILSMLAEQMLAISQLQNSSKTSNSEWSYWHGQILAERLLAQLNGWLQLVTALPMLDKEGVLAETELCIRTLVELLNKPLPMNATTGDTSPWGTVFQTLRQLSVRLT